MQLEDRFPSESFGIIPTGTTPSLGLSTKSSSGQSAPPTTFERHCLAAGRRTSRILPCGGIAFLTRGPICLCSTPLLYLRRWSRRRKLALVPNPATIPFIYPHSLGFVVGDNHQRRVVMAPPCCCSAQKGFLIPSAIQERQYDHISPKATKAQSRLYLDHHPHSADYTCRAGHERRRHGDGRRGARPLHPGSSQNGR